MKKGKKTLVIVGAVVIGIVLVVGGVRTFILRKPFPDTKGSVRVEGLSTPVEILRDDDGVPHIYADNMEDLFFAQGYVHAQDRFWQMEFWRRAGSGRLAELFGEAVLGIDMYMRTMGFGEIVEKEYALLDGETRRYLEAYAAGVNTYILNRKPAKLGLEFILLSLQGVEFEIEPWTPVHTLIWCKLMAEQMSGNLQEELYTMEMIRAVGVDMTADFFPAYREDVMPYVISDDEISMQEKPQEPVEPFEATEEHIALLEDCPTRLVGGYDSNAFSLFGTGVGVGSNAWAISGRLTDTGLPLLANDTHLRIQMPSIYYEIGLHCKDDGNQNPFNVRGFSCAGMPGVIIGHNDRIAWGFTTMYLDVQDLYIERINPYNPHQYEVNGEWVDMELRVEEIAVHDWDEPYRLLVRSTRHGPIITDHGKMAAQNNFNIIPGKLFPANLELTVLSLRWTALELQKIPHTIVSLDRARNFDEFHEALRHFGVPVFNVVYADVDGNIGYQAPGMSPIRAKGDGRIPVPGWTDEYEWIGYVQYESMPLVLNPPKGYIITANNPVVSSRYPYDLVLDFDHGYRARRIMEMIEQRGSNLSFDDMREMQGDTLSLSAFEILPYMRSLSFEDSVVKDALDSLLEWDGRMEMDSGLAALYAYFWVALVETIFRDELPERLWTKDGGVVGARSGLLSCVYNLLQEPTNPWWDDATTLDSIEVRDDILVRAFEKAYRRGVEEFGEELDEWRWGEIHTATFQNATFGRSGIGIIEKIFNRGPVETSGGFHQVNRSDFSIDEPFKVYHITSNRQIVDLSDLSNSVMILPTGQSGHPGHRHYDDFIEPWRLIEYHSTRWEREGLEEGKTEKLVLKPL